MNRIIQAMNAKVQELAEIAQVKESKIVSISKEVAEKEDLVEKLIVAIDVRYGLIQEMKRKLNQNEEKTICNINVALAEEKEKTRSAEEIHDRK